LQQENVTVAILVTILLAQRFLVRVGPADQPFDPTAARAVGAIASICRTL